MFRSLLFSTLLALSAPLGFAQGAVRGLSHDFTQWTGPLAQTAAEDTKHFRTFMMGYIHSGGTSFSLGNAPLAGFDVNFTDSKDSPRIHAITPIFAPAEDTITIGTQIGTPDGKKARLVGKNGYVVTGVALNHNGSYYAGMQVRFSKLLPDGTCDLADSYATPAIGAEGGKLLEAKPIPFCGIHASSANPAVLDGISFLVLQELVRDKAPDLVPKTRAIGGASPMAPEPQPAAPAPAPQVVMVQSDNPVLDPRVAGIVKDSFERLVLVKGAIGVGSGFVYKVNGRAFFATNQHVVVGNQKLQFQPLSNKISLKLGAAQAAVGHDVMVIPVQPEIPGFETSLDVSKEVSIGDAIVVLGDPEGAGVVRPITGRVLGIGPNLVEVSAQFVEGNSGSPIVHVKSGKVIGIATYASMRAFDAGAGQMGVQVRRFGYRLDSVQKWQPVDWAAYQADAATAAAGKTYTEALAALCVSIIKGTFNPVEHKDPRLKNALARFPKANATETQMQQQTEAFVREVRNATKMQSDDLRRRLRYDYFARDVDADLQLRELILNALDQTKGRIAPGGAPTITPARAPRGVF